MKYSVKLFSLLLWKNEGDNFSVNFSVNFSDNFSDGGDNFSDKQFNTSAVIYCWQIQTIASRETKILEEEPEETDNLLFSQP